MDAVRPAGRLAAERLDGPGIHHAQEHRRDDRHAHRGSPGHVARHGRHASGPKDFLDIVVGGEDVKAPKPSPEGVKFALEHLGSSPEETLYIGDSTVDAETAQNAGVDFAGVLNGMTTAEELRVYPHKIIMQNLGELVQ